MAELSSEVSTSWRKSSYSGGTGCVEVRAVGSAIQVRDTKNPAGAVLSFTGPEWEAFIEGVRAGEFTIRDRRWAQQP